jgi:hypothetical protein
MRSKFFTPLTQLSILNERISSDYFSEASAIIEVNTKRYNEENYDESVSFSEVLRYFKDFLQRLSIKIDHSQLGCHEID